MERETNGYFKARFVRDVCILYASVRVPVFRSSLSLDQTPPTYSHWSSRLITVRKRKLRKGNVFTPVCDFVHRGEVYTPSWQTLPWQTHTPGRHPLADIPPGRHPPSTRRPLQRTVCIILECILVIYANFSVGNLDK